MTNWKKEPPVEVKGHWCFLDAQNTPFFYAYFKSENDAIHARNLYLETIGSPIALLKMRPTDTVEAYL
jgi:hypothetical protein